VKNKAPNGFYITLIIMSFVLSLLIEKPVFGQQSQDQQQAGNETAGNQTLSGVLNQVKKELTAPVPLLEIKRLESEEPLYSIELRDVQLADLFRVIAHDYNLNILIDKEITGTITASFTNVSLEEALDSIAEMHNLSLEKKGNILRVVPNFLTKTIVLKYIEAKKLLDPINADQPSAGQAVQETNQTQSQSSIYSLLSEKGKILLGKQQNSITVIDYPANVKRVEDYIAVMDHKMTTRVFKLKYLKADEVTGVTNVTQTTTQTISDEGAKTTSTTTATKLQ
jgi:type II secretory pathway component GspD/PulD (secretin)